MPVERDLMRLQFEPGGGQIRDTFSATVDVEHFVAITTEKMVMMTAVGPLVAHIISTEVHGANLSGVLEASKLSINGCDPQRWHHWRGQVEDFQGAKWSVRFANDPYNCVALTSMSVTHVDTS